MNTYYLIYKIVNEYHKPLPQAEIKAATFQDAVIELKTQNEGKRIKIVNWKKDETISSQKLLFKSL